MFGEGVFLLASTSKEAFSDLLFKDGRPILEIRIEYPVAQGQVTENFERTFNIYYERDARLLNLSARTNIHRDALTRYTSSKKEGLPFNMYSVVQEFQTTFVSENYLSLCRRRQTYTGGAHGKTEMKSDVWSLSSARRLTLQEVAKERDSVKIAIKAVQKAIYDDGSGRFYPHAMQAAEKAFDPRNFYLTEKGIFVFYPTYTLAPHYAGIQVFETGLTVK